MRALSISCFVLRLLAVQKRANTADPRLLSFKRPACKVGPWQVPRNLDFRRLPTTLKLLRVVYCA